MAGIDLDSGGGRRRSLDTQVNMIPMIDLLMVTISFLLITAVWSHMGRLEASAQVRGAPPEPCGDCAKEKDRALHVDIRPDGYLLTWREGRVVVQSIDVPRDKLGEVVKSEWEKSGQHRAPTDAKRDQAILHAPNGAAYEELVAAMDALGTPKRTIGRDAAPAFFVTLAAD